MLQGRERELYDQIADLYSTGRYAEFIGQINLASYAEPQKLIETSSSKGIVNRFSYIRQNTGAEIAIKEEESEIRMVLLAPTGQYFGRANKNPIKTVMKGSIPKKIFDDADKTCAFHRRLEKAIQLAPRLEKIHEVDTKDWSYWTLSTLAGVGVVLASNYFTNNPGIDIVAAGAYMKTGLNRKVVLSGAQTIERFLMKHNGFNGGQWALEDLAKEMAQGELEHHRTVHHHDTYVSA